MRHTFTPISNYVQLCFTSRNVIYEADLVKVKGLYSRNRELTHFHPVIMHRLSDKWEVKISKI